MNNSNTGFTTPKKSQRNQRDENNINDELDDNLYALEYKRQQSELRGKIEDRQILMQQQKESQSISNQTCRIFQIINIFVSLLFGIGCLTLYPEIHLVNKRVFFLVIFYMAISIICFFFSLIIMIIFWLGSKIFRSNQQQQQQQIQNQHSVPSHQNTNRSNVANHDVELYNSQLNNQNNHYSSATNLVNNNNYNNYNSNNAQLNQSMESEHSVIAFRNVNYNQDQVPWCNVGWFPLVYSSTLYIAYFFYLVFSTTLIIDTWQQIPLLISIFLGYIYIVGALHVLLAITLLFSRKFISRHIEEMEEAEVYRVDDIEIKRRKQEILEARNKDIQNINRGK